MTPTPPEAEQSHGRLAHLAYLAHQLADADPSTKLPALARWLMTVGPFVGFGLIVLVVYLLYGRHATTWLVGVEIGSFIGGGKFVILAGAHPHAPLSVWSLATLVVYGDTGTMLVMLANLHLLYRLPRFGPKLAQGHRACHYVLKANPWMNRLAWLGCAVYIAVPFQGTGAVIGTLLARLLGMSFLATLTSIPFGSALGCYPMALLGRYLKRHRGYEWIMHNWLISIAFTVVLIGLLYVLGRRFTGADLQKKEAAQAAGQEKSS